MHLTIHSPYISPALHWKLRVENGKYYKKRLQCDLSLCIIVVFLHTSSPLVQFLLFLTQNLVHFSNTLAPQLVKIWEISSAVHIVIDQRVSDFFWMNVNFQVIGLYSLPVSLCAAPCVEWTAPFYLNISRQEPLLKMLVFVAGKEG